MVPTLPATTEKKTDYRGALIIAPPSAAGTPWMRRFGEHSSGFCSGWMRVRGDRRRRGYDRGFVISDHADWPGLLDTCLATRAKRVLLTHGYSDALARYLNERGVDSRRARHGLRSRRVVRDFAELYDEIDTTTVDQSQGRRDGALFPQRRRRRMRRGPRTSFPGAG